METFDRVLLAVSWNFEDAEFISARRKTYIKERELYAKIKKEEGVAIDRLFARWLSDEIAYNTSLEKAATLAIAFILGKPPYDKHFSGFPQGLLCSIEHELNCAMYKILIPETNK